MAVTIGVLSTALLIVLSFPLIFIFKKKWNIPAPFTFALAYLLIFIFNALSYPEEFGAASIGFKGLHFMDVNISLPVWHVYGFSPLEALTLKGLANSVTSSYIHKGVLHLGFNIIILILLGVPFERKVGTGRFTIIYILSNVLTCYLVAALDLGVNLPPYFSPFKVYFGASASISGILGAYYMIFPHDRIFFPVFFIITKVKVHTALLAYLILQSALALFFPDVGIGFFAHIMGVLAGVILGVMLGSKIREQGGAKQVFRGGKTLDPALMKQLERIAGEDHKLREILEKLEGEKDRDIIEAWLEKFFSLARCPECGGELGIKGRNVRCGQCGGKF